MKIFLIFTAVLLFYVNAPAQQNIALRGSVPSDTVSQCIARETDKAPIEVNRYKRFSKSTLEIKANGSDPLALCILGLGLLLEDAPQKDKERARFYLTYAAEKNHAPSMYYMYYIYYNGLGVDNDTKRAMEYLHAAVENGDRDAVCTLAKHYTTGEGVTPNYIKAAELFAQVNNKCYGGEYAHYEEATDKDVVIGALIARFVVPTVLLIVGLFVFAKLLVKFFNK